MTSFTNPARTDGLLLKHWRKKGAPKAAGTTGAGASRGEEEHESLNPDDAPDHTYHYAKFNLEITSPEYTAYEYQTHLQSDGWTKEETDYLVDLCASFDLRWPVISDRYQYPPYPASSSGACTNTIPADPPFRSLEDLKARYYVVASRMMAVHHPLSSMSATEFDLHEKMSKFDAAQETRRKHMAEALLSRTPEEVAEENLLIAELKRITDAQDKLVEDRRELYARLESPSPITLANTAALNPAAALAINHPQTYQTSQGLTQLMQNLMNVDKNKKRRSLMGGGGNGPITSISTTDVTSSPVSNTPNPTPTTATMKDSLTSSHRDSITSTTPLGTTTSSTTINNKKTTAAQALAPPQRRKLTPHELSLYGVSHHDRLTSGVTFRHDKVARMLAAKSNIQAQRVARALTELEIPPRLVMPTVKVCSEYERLINNIHVLVDVRKVAEKVEGEWKVLLASKEDRERRQRLERGETEPSATEDEGVKAEQGSVKVEIPPETDAEAGAATAGAHKRGASVLSAVSGGSPKRQKL